MLHEDTPFWYMQCNTLDKIMRKNFRFESIVFLGSNVFDLLSVDNPAVQADWKQDGSSMSANWILPRRSWQTSPHLVRSQRLLGPFAFPSVTAVCIRQYKRLDRVHATERYGTRRF